MTDKPEKPASGDPNAKPKNPRGFGGVVLILALLLALFVVVSTSGMEGNDSEDAFYSRLFRGQITKTIVESQGIVTAEYRGPRGQGGQEADRHGWRAVLHGGAPAQEVRMMIRRILGPRTSAGILRAANGLAQFYRDVRSGKLSVKEAFVVSETAGPRPRGQGRAEGSRKASS